MTTEEIYWKYKDIFIISMETAGEETGNSVYKNVEELINRHESEFLRLMSEGAPFNLIVLDMICMLVLEVHGPEKLEDQELSEYIMPVFNLYLKKSTRAFCTQNGIPVVDISKWGSVVKRIRRNNT